MRGHGEYPTVYYSFIGKLGLRKRSIEIHEYYLEYIGGEWIGEKNLVDFLSSQVFHSDDLRFRRQWDNEDLILTFKLSNVKVNEHRHGDKNIEADVDILEGYINLDEYDETQDEYNQVRYDISRGNNEIDDMSTYFDVQDEIRTIIQSFIIEFAIKYGTEITDSEVEILK